MIYIITFLISILFIKLSMITSKSNKIVSKIFEIIGILIPCILAAFRDYTIGTDVNVYISPLFTAAQRSTSFLSFYDSMNSVTDFLYLFITYECSRISQNIGGLFFCIELLVILPIYITLKKKFKNSNCLLLGMSLFFLFFYNQSYNMARQSIAIAFIMLGMSFLDEEKNKSFIVCFLIACLFHNTATIFIAVFFLYKLISTNKIDRKLKFFIEAIIVIGCIIAAFFLPQLITIAGNLGIIELIKSEVYLNKFVRSSVDISYIHSIIYLYVLFIVIIYRKRIREREKNATYYIFASLLSFIILQLGTVMAYAERIGYYVFYPVLITILPYIIWPEKNKKRISKNDFYIFLITMIIFIAYWIIWICLINYNETFPYVFR